jgi:hypothetical protein
MMGALRHSAPLLAALGTIGLVGGTLLALWVPELTRFSLVTLIASMGLLAAASAASLDVIVKTFMGRRGRFSGMGLATVAIAVGLAVMVNVVANATGVSWDLTATRQFEISPQAVAVLEALDTPVEVFGFIMPSNESDSLFRAKSEQLLNEFAKHTDQISYRFVDPDLEPTTARSFGATRFPALVFASDPSGTTVAVDKDSLSEQRMVTAILSVTQTKQHVIYFVEGHGERDSNDLRADSLGYGVAARGLRADGYSVLSLNLLRTGVPHDASALIIAAPQGEMTQAESGSLASWLTDGGRAVWLLEPHGAFPESTHSLLATWGLEQLQGAVVDPPRSAASDQRNLLVQRDQYLSGTAITQGGAIAGPLGSVLLPGASALRPLPEIARRLEEGRAVPVRYGSIANSSDASWVSTDLDRDVFGDSDVRGPHTLAIAMEASGTITESPSAKFALNRPLTRLVVFGDTDFASNRHFTDLGNGDLFLNAVNWVLEDQSLISIRAKTEVFRPLVLTANEFNVIRYVAWFLLPAAMAACAVFFWWRRR